MSIEEEPTLADVIADAREATDDAREAADASKRKLSAVLMAAIVSMIGGVISLAVTFTIAQDDREAELYKAQLKLCTELVLGLEGDDIDRASRRATSFTEEYGINCGDLLAGIPDAVGPSTPSTPSSDGRRGEEGIEGDGEPVENEDEPDDEPVENEDEPDEGDAEPSNAVEPNRVAFFEGSCPAGWTLYEPLIGRYVVGSAAGSGQPVGRALRRPGRSRRVTASVAGETGEANPFATHNGRFQVPRRGRYFLQDTRGRETREARHRHSVSLEATIRAARVAPYVQLVPCLQLASEAS